MPRLFARGSDGVVCIHTGSDDVVDDPTIDLSRVLFHSDLDYPTVTTIYTPSISLPARSTSPVYAQHTLFAHGLAGTPFVLGYISNMSNLPLVGSVPVDGQSAVFGRFVTLGANATNVILYEETVISAVLSARTLDMVIYVTDLLL